MASSINATTINGIQTYADNTGSLNIQGSGNTHISLTPTAISFPNGINFPNGDFVNNGGIGIGQTWQDVTASRALATTYTNSTGKPIEVIVSCFNSTTVGAVTATVGGVLLGHDGSSISNAGGSYAAISFIVPNGVSYSVSVTAGTWSITKWAELR